MKNRTSSLAVLVWIIVYSYCPLLFAAGRRTDHAEVAALKKIKASLGDPYGNLKNWGKGDPCNVPWTGVICSNATLSDGYFHVQQLELLTMNLTGNLAPEIGNLQQLIILDFMWNNISGSIPKEIGNITTLQLLQLDNNHFTSTIPHSYVNMTKLLKLSLRNCSLQGTIPDFSVIPALGYLDLSHNGLTGSIPSQKLSSNITTIDLSYNKLNGPIPSSFADLPLLQKLSLDNNQLTGSAPSDIGLKISFKSTARLFLDFQNNYLSNITDINNLANQPPNITLWLHGNPVCNQTNIIDISKLCSTKNGSEDTGEISNDSNAICNINKCAPPYYVNVPDTHCFCAAPIEVGYRLKSPGFTYFPPYIEMFVQYITSGLELQSYQVSIDSYSWVPGPRLAMNLMIFPPINQTVRELNKSEILRIRNLFAGWKIFGSDIFGPYEWINITLEGPYQNVKLGTSGSGLSKRALAGIWIGSIFGTAIASAIILTFLFKRHAKFQEKIASRKKLLVKKRVKGAGVKDFDFEEMALATNNFSASMKIGQGGFGKVYKGILNNGTIVAIKRAQEGSLQGEREFLNEIELLSRVHHRNLVSLLGYCDDQGEQGRDLELVKKDPCFAA